MPGTGSRTEAGDGPFSVRLSAGEPIASLAAITQVVDGEPLDDAALQAVYDRLPEWIVDDDQPDFNRPADSLRPPLVGETVAAPFPPVPGTDGPDPAVPGTGPLQVLRYQPEGEVAVAPYLSVTFDQPMVPLATLDQLDEAEVPAAITPAIEGRWRWIGTRTLRFEVEPGLVDRLPAATEFTVEVPAGTTSETGGVLEEAVTWTFATPPVQVERIVPMHDSLPLEPVFFVGFDQVVAPDAVLATATLTVDGADRTLRLATEAEIEADDAARAAVENALDGRWLALRPTEPLPADASVELAIGPDTPSAEGPRTTAEAHVERGRTYPPLAVDDSGCSYGDRCEPGTPLFVRFTNPLDLAAFDRSLVTVEPAIPGLNVNAYGDTIEMYGATAGRTDYRITIAGALADVHGQTLGQDATVEIETGDARPYLAPFDRQFVTVDPLADDPAIDLVTVNHESVRVRAWRVEPADQAEFQRWVERFWDEQPPPDPDWPEVLDQVVEIDGAEDAQIESSIDLTDAFADTPSSQLVVRIDPTREFARNSDEWWMNRPTAAWVQSTTLGLDAFLDGETLHVWTTDLTTGEPVGGVAVELLGPGTTVTTDADGLASAPLTSTGVRALVGRLDGATAMLSAGWYEGWTRQASTDQLRWYTFDDRGTYRPGETVRLKGWVRDLTLSQDAELRRPDAETVAFTAYDAFGNEIADGSAPVNALGGFDLDFAIPEGANLGYAWVELRLDGSSQRSTSHQYQIQEFRRPEFEVTTRPESPAPYLMAEPLTVAAEAAYFAGGPLPDAPVEWTVTTRDAAYAPPGHPDFSFGVWTPWWLYDDGFGHGFAADVAAVDYECFELDCGPGFPGGDADVETFTGRTDGSGTHYLRMDFDAPDVDLPRTVTAQATVTDVNRQAWADRTDLLVHPADVYVGLRSDRSFVRQGDPLVIETIVADVDGEVVAGRPVSVTAARVESQYVDGTWTEVEVDPQTCEVTSTAEVVICEFATPVGGTVKVTAIVTDEAGRANRSELTRWVSGGDTVPRNRRVELETATLVPDRDEYAPGDTAEILVQAPFAPASGHLTVERNGIVSTEVFDAPDGSAVLQIPLTDDRVPGVTVQVDLVGTAPRVGDDGEPIDGAPPRPAFATGRLDLRIPPTTRELAVTATPAAPEAEPGATTSVELAVAGPDGAPVAGAEVAVVVVDEAILALSSYQLPDPLGVFYAPFGSTLWAEYVRSTIALRNPFELAEGGSDAAADDGGDGGAESAAPPTTTAAFEDSADADLGFRATSQAGGPPIDVRENFDALAVYAPSETTGADGTVTVEVPLPDTLTRYRVMAVAVDGDDRFGSGESTITARLPLSVRPSAPRFLNFGDAFELPIVVQNLGDADRTVDVVVQTSNLTLTEGAGRRVTVPAGDRVEVRFPAAADEVGTARFRAAVVGGDSADAATVELPVYTPATAEAFATYGVVDDGAIAQPVLAPEGVFPQFGGLEVTTSSTAVQALTDAVLYLAEYRYESADAYASRILAITALRDVLEAFEAEGLPSPAELEATVERDLDGLTGLQNGDGGFGWWRPDGRSDPYVSIHATHAIVAAEAEGYPVPGETRELALSYLRDIENRYPSTYSQAVRDSLSAYALHVRDRAGDRDAQKARTLYQRAGDTLALDALAWLWPVIDDPAIETEIERRFSNAAVETPGAATFTTGYGEDAYLVLASDRRTDGIVLDALIGERPDSDLIPKVVAGLLGNQVRGRWNNAQENAFILLALHRYFETYEAQDPDFVARVWLGETYAAEHAYAGRSTDRNETLVPMAELVAGGDTDVIVAKDGAGRLYYRLGLRYAPDDLTLDPRDEGFVVDRVYEPVGDPGDVTREADGSWRIRAGAEIRVRLTMVADARRTHVALIDPLPAGLEPLNPALEVSADLPPDPEARESGWCWCWTWYEHQNLRDDRVEAHTSYLSAGTYEYTYLARATTPGTFVVPPARAEEVYAPEVFGRSGSARVVVEE